VPLAISPVRLVEQAISKACRVLRQVPSRVSRIHEGDVKPPPDRKTGKEQCRPILRVPFHRARLLPADRNRRERLRVG